MKVRIMSGNQLGAVIEMRQDEAEAAFATGFGESAETIDAPVIDAEPAKINAGKKKKGDEE